VNHRQTSDPKIREWYQGLMQPDLPQTSAAAKRMPVGPMKSVG
jgi:hypothetical protein